MSARQEGPRRTRPETTEPLVIVCAGGGGVGKTTTSAALGVALAASGLSTLVVTIDPARRLASAMGVVIGDEVTPVAWEGTHGRLHALMPDPRRSLRTFVDTIFEGEPEAKAHLLQNRMYIGLSDAAAGVHELVAMTLVANAAAGGQFDVVVIDTAPSRHAIDFVTYPQRLAALLGGRTIAWLSGIADRAQGQAQRNAQGSAQARERGGGMLAWGAGRVDALLARVTGPNLVGDAASLFGDLAKGRGRFVALAEHAAALLLGDRTSYVLVAAPSAAARDDVFYLHARLSKLGRVPRALVLNRADVKVPSYASTLRDAAGTPPSVLETVEQLELERVARSRAADAVAADCARSLPGLPLVRLPFIEAIRPADVVVSLAHELGPHLGSLLPRT